MLLGGDIREIIALTFVVTLANSAASAIPYWRRGLVDIRVAIAITLAAMVGVLAGYQIGGHLSPRLLECIMLVALTYAGWKLVSAQARVSEGADSPCRASWWQLLLFGLLAGIVMGIMGGGGGVFIAIVLMVVFTMSAKTAVGTSIVIMGGAAIPGLLLHAQAGNMRWDLVLTMIPVSMLAAFFTARWGRGLPNQHIKRMLGGLLLLMVSVLFLKQCLAWLA